MRATGEEIELGILRVLEDTKRPVGASQIGALLLTGGIDLQPRTVRYYLLRLDERGMTRLVSRRQGREITDRGREEVHRAGASDRMRITSAKIDSLGYRMSLDAKSGIGSVIVNVTTVDVEDLGRTAREVQLVVNQGFAMGKRVAVAEAGETLAGVVVPDGVVAMGTICSMTLNGILQKQGIPVLSRFGGILEVRERRLVRFVEMIEYAGSTLDPLEVFIRAGMTRVRNVVLRGSGSLCASFREVPAAAMDHIRVIQRDMKRHDLGGILALGKPNQPLLGVQVSEGHCGMVVAGGLNAMAAAREAGVRMKVQSLSGLEDYARFQRVRALLRR